MVYSAQDAQREITDEAIATAIKIGDYLERVAMSIFGDTSTTTQGRIEHMLVTRLARNKNMMGLRDLRLAIGGTADRTQFNQALTNLDRADIVRVVPPLSEKTRQPRTVFLLRDSA